MPEPIKHGQPGPRLIYVMGTGRSGTTVLEILLSHVRGAFGAGELTKLVDDGFLQNKTCSCGSTFDECPIWGLIRSRSFEPEGEMQDLSSLLRRTDRHIGFWWQVFRRCAPASKYVDFNLGLLAAISDTTGARLVVDSSKYAGRAMALDKILGSSLAVIWLTRDPAGILRSFRTPNKDEQRPKSLAVAALYVVYVTLCCKLAQRRLTDRCVVLRYEDLITRPSAELRRLGEWANIDVDPVTALVQNVAKMPVGHLITANRLRKAGYMSLGQARSIVTDDGVALRLLASLLRVWYRILGLT